MSHSKKVFAGLLFLLALASPALWAEKYDIKTMTPQIEEALKNRQNRYNQIQSMKDGGVLGEDNRGYIKVIKQIPEADAMAEAENADRRVIYIAIVDQNYLGSNGLGAVQATFAEVQRDKAASGNYIQLPTGEWTKK